MDRENFLRRLKYAQRKLRLKEKKKLVVNKKSNIYGGSIIDASALHASLCCPICFVTLINCVILPCSHGYCRSCLETEWCKIGSRGACLVCHDIKNLKTCNKISTDVPLFLTSSFQYEYLRSDHIDNVLYLLTEGFTNDIRHVSILLLCYIVIKLYI